MQKVDYKKEDKHLYVPKSQPVIVDVPKMTFVSLHGTGDPNESEFSEATAALYSFSYAVKMSYKGSTVPENYYEYTVYPLEGVWDLVDLSKPSTDKSNYSYDIMIRQPDFLTKDWFDYFLESTQKKKPNPHLSQIEFISLEEGLCCQMMHMGPYDTEPESFKQMEAFCLENGYERISKTHREIYLSDPRKTQPQKMKTVLRFNVIKIND